MRLAKAGSAVLLTEDGVVGAMKGTKHSPDLKARGFSESNVVDGIKVVDYSGFVDLAAEYESVQAWL